MPVIMLISVDLAAARLADHRNELAAVDLQVDPAQRSELPGRGLIGLYDRAKLDEVVVAVAIQAGLDRQEDGCALFVRNLNTDHSCVFVFACFCGQSHCIRVAARHL